MFYDFHHLLIKFLKLRVGLLPIHQALRPKGPPVVRHGQDPPTLHRTKARLKALFGWVKHVNISYEWAKKLARPKFEYGSGCIRNFLPEKKI